MPTRRVSAFSGALIIVVVLLLSVLTPFAPANRGNAAPAEQPAPMVLKYDISIGDTVTIPIRGFVDLEVDWGEGAPPEPIASEPVRHTYATSGLKVVKVYATSATGFGDSNLIWDPAQAKLTAVESFGELGITDFSWAFVSAANLKKVPSTLPTSPKVENITGMFHRASSFTQDLSQWDVSQVTSMRHLFNDALEFNGNISTWQTQNVIDMAHLFDNAPKFNQDISSWQTPKLTSLFRTFKDARAFNQPIGSWDVSGVTDFRETFQNATSFNQPLGDWKIGANVDFSATSIDMQSMFEGAVLFNQDINSWDVSKVTYMFGLFRHASAFNQHLNSWKTGNVLSMTAMFSGATNFNGAIGSWDVSKVRFMNQMFQGAAAFNQDISGWNTSAVENMSEMFWGATTFNQDISRWNVSRVTSMIAMFYDAQAFNANISTWKTTSLTETFWMFLGATSFNQPIGTWNMRLVTNMAEMFREADSFNQNLASWDTSSVTNMHGVFRENNAFNQSLGSWNIAKVTDLNYILLDTAISPANYDATLNGWAGQNVVSNLEFTSGWNTFYTAAGENARTELIGTDGWIINDGGLRQISVISSPPTVLPIEWGTPLEDSMLIGGTADNPGNFTFGKGETVLDAGTHQVVVTFLPEDYMIYLPATTNVTVVVKPLQQLLTQQSGPASGAVLTDPQPFVLDITSSANLAVTFAASGSCLVTGDTLTFPGAGVCTVTASQAGNNNVLAAEDLVIEYFVQRTDMPAETAIALAKTALKTPELNFLVLFALLLGIGLFRHAGRKLQTPE